MNGSAGAWEDFPDVCPGNYTVQWGGGAVLTVRKQYIGNFTLKSGGMVGCPNSHPDSGTDDVLSAPVLAHGIKAWVSYMFQQPVLMLTARQESSCAHLPY